MSSQLLINASTLSCWIFKQGDAFLFDFYENAAKQQVKAAYRFIFQDYSKTLTDSEINQELEPLLSEILKLNNVSIPGYKNDIPK